MKSLMLFLETALHEMGGWCHTSTIFDLKTIENRVEHEGLEFLTITLPSFGKGLEKGLEDGFVDPNLFKGFPFSGMIPKFLSGFMGLVFDRSTGVLLDEPNVDAIRCIRQITLMFAKIEKECSEERTLSAFAKYVECESDVRAADQAVSESLWDDYTRIGRLLWTEMFSSLDHKVYEGDILPKHGPGATADGLRGNAKYTNLEWTQRLETFFPHGEYLFSSWSLFLEAQDQTIVREPGAERPVKVIAVPKTQSTPRIIAVEPTCMQYVQQGLLEAIVDGIEADDIASRLINFESQIPNRELARRGSISGRLATLDLSEASDRVSYQHVRKLLARFPSLLGGIDACRSRKADVPNHGVIRLAKFASMGSALCFPFEAIVFATVIFVGIEKELNTRLTRSSIKDFLGSVRVYGDDIIVPVAFVSSVIHHLEAFGLKVNVNKSFWKGKFRESCGGDYYAGHDVSIVRLRSEFPTSRKHASELVSTVSLRNQLFKAGFDTTVELLDTWIERLIPFPIVEETSSALGRWSDQGFTAERLHFDLQIPLVRAAVVSSKLPISRLEGYGALMKWFLKRGDLPFADRDHLVRAGRPVSVDIKTRWTCPY